jgi:hypothetical protein
VAEEFFGERKVEKGLQAYLHYEVSWLQILVRKSNIFVPYAIRCLIRKVKIEDRSSTMTEREREIIIQKKIANVSLQYLVLVYLYSPRAVLMLSVVLRRTTMEDNENLDCI